MWLPFGGYIFIMDTTMPITSITRDWGVNPSIVRITSTDTLEDVADENYVTSQESVISSLNNGDFEWIEGDSILIAASDGNGFFQFTGDDFATFVPMSSGGGGSVVLPTVANRIAHFTDTEGTTSSDPADITNLGDINAGESGTEGGLIAYPPTPSTGKIKVEATANSGDYTVTITNNAVGQDTSFAIAASFLASNIIPALPSIVTPNSGNLVSFSGSSGLITDSGISAFTVNGLPKYLNVSVVTTDLSSGGKSFVLPASSGIWIIRNILVNYGAPLTTGDRNIVLRDATGIYTTIDSSLLLSPANVAWGDTNLPYPSMLPLNRGNDFTSGIYFIYDGGTTDYDAGEQFTVTIEYTE